MGTTSIETMTQPETPSSASSFLIEPQVLIEQREALELLLVDTRLAEPYAAGHIPGAINVSTYEYFVKSTSPFGLSRAQREVAQRYSAAGITPSRPVVVYDDQTGIRAARECWMLQYLGHPDARLLHGGLNAWRQAGGPISTDAPAIHSGTFTATPHPELVIGVNDILARSGSSETTMLDVRDREEFTGDGGPPCCIRRGRIPGAVWIEWTAFLDAETGRFKAPDAICQLLREHGIEPDQDIVTYCHRGARSANTSLALRAAGCANVRNFIGSWHEWAARRDLPIESGEG